MKTRSRNTFPRESQLPTHTPQTNFAVCNANPNLRLNVKNHNLLNVGIMLLKHTYVQLRCRPSRRGTYGTSLNIHIHCLTVRHTNRKDEHLVDQTQ